jgi:membrane protein CcdC involved in cytochrome C biogenesis
VFFINCMLKFVYPPTRIKVKKVSYGLQLGLTLNRCVHYRSRFSVETEKNVIPKTFFQIIFGRIIIVIILYVLTCPTGKNFIGYDVNEKATHNPLL